MSRLLLVSLAVRCETLVKLVYSVLYCTVCTVRLPARADTRDCVKSILQIKLQL